MVFKAAGSDKLSYTVAGQIYPFCQQNHTFCDASMKYVDKNATFSPSETWIITTGSAQMAVSWHDLKLLS